MHSIDVFVGIKDQLIELESLVLKILDGWLAWFTHRHNPAALLIYLENEPIMVYYWRGPGEKLYVTTIASACTMHAFRARPFVDNG